MDAAQSTFAPQVVIFLVLGVAQLIAILGGGTAVAFRMGRSTRGVEASIELQRVTSVATQQTLSELKIEVSAMRTLMTEVALQKQEIGRQGQAIERLERWYDELRRGVGVVMPAVPRPAA